METDETSSIWENLPLTTDRADEACPIQRELGVELNRPSDHRLPFRLELEPAAGGMAGALVKDPTEAIFDPETKRPAFRIDSPGRS